MSVNLLLGILIGALVVVRVMGRQLRGSMVTQKSLVVLLRLVPTILVLGSILHTATSSVRTRLPFPLILLLSAIVVLGNLALLRYDEPSRARTAGLLVFVIAGSLLWFALPNGVLAILPFWAARVAVRYHLPGRAEILVVLLSIVGVALPILVLTDSIASAVGTAFGVVALVLASVNRRAREEQLEQLEVSLARKQAAIEEHSRAAALAERARIARDVHDVLAHSLAGLSLSLQGARLMLVRDGASAEAIDQVTRALPPRPGVRLAGLSPGCQRRSWRWMVIWSPGLLPIRVRRSALTGSLWVPSPRAMNALSNG